MMSKDEMKEEAKQKIKKLVERNTYKEKTKCKPQHALSDDGHDCTYQTGTGRIIAPNAG